MPSHIPCRRYFNKRRVRHYYKMCLPCEHTSQSKKTFNDDYTRIIQRTIHAIFQKWDGKAVIVILNQYPEDMITTILTDILEGTKSADTQRRNRALY